MSLSVAVDDSLPAEAVTVTQVAVVFTAIGGPDRGIRTCTTHPRNKAGIAYEVIDVSTDQRALEYVRSLGYAQVPVVVAWGGHWSGYRPDRVRGLAE